jgi:hypothetical protein
MNPAEAPGAIPSASRSVLVTSLAWLTIVVGALGTPISGLALLMILAGGPGSSTFEPLGFLIVVVLPLAAIVAGIGLLRRKRWAHHFLLVLILWALAHHVYLLARGPIPQSTHISASGVPTTTLETPVSPHTLPTILMCACLAVLLLTRRVRTECSVA